MPEEFLVKWWFMGGQVRADAGDLSKLEMVQESRAPEP